MNELDVDLDTMELPRPATTLRRSGRGGMRIATRDVGAVTIFVLTVGVLTWAWSVGLILSRVPKGELIATGLYAVVKHPLYTSVGLLVLPSLGLLLGTWLGVVIGLAVYVGSRLFAPAEEAELRKTFGVAWDAYARSVKLPWL